jgi:hypothetical protein
MEIFFNLLPKKEEKREERTEMAHGSPGSYACDRLVGNLGLPRGPQPGIDRGGTQGDQMLEQWAFSGSETPNVLMLALLRNCTPNPGNDLSDAADDTRKVGIILSKGTNVLHETRPIESVSRGVF